VRGADSGRNDVHRTHLRQLRFCGLRRGFGTTFARVLSPLA
jgi:hypothetical protein